MYTFMGGAGFGAEVGDRGCLEHVLQEGEEETSEPDPKSGDYDFGE